MNELLASPEIIAIREFLSRCVPFDGLEGSEINALIPTLKIAYYRQGHIFDSKDLIPLSANSSNTKNDNTEDGLRIVRSGAVELRDVNDNLMDRFGEGVSFNLRGLNQESPGLRAVLIEDSLIYYLNERDYQTLRHSHRFIDRFFHHQRSRRIRRNTSQSTAAIEAAAKVGDLMTHDVLVVAPEETIQVTAKKMNGRHVSSALVVEAGALKGIVTDRDIRSRAVAKNIDIKLPIKTIMTADPTSLTSEATLFDATLLMLGKGFHHLPVVDKEKLQGIITTSDLILSRQNDPVYFVQHLSRQTTVEGMKELTKTLPNLLVQWTHQNLRVHQISKILTAISDAVTKRLIEMGIAELGPAPVPFCWLGFGSQGRREQLLGADQDNGLVISNELKDEDKPWFEKLSHRVCDGLNECGYVYCNGKIMATTDEWRQPLTGWENTISRWTRNPNSDAVMRVSIFFDLRAIYGDESLCESLQQHMLKSVVGHTIFLAALAESVLDTPPPLGFFRRFVVERNGEHRDQLNVKKSAIIPLVDIVRIHALANNIRAINTTERLEALADKKVMSKVDSRNLRDALEIFMRFRLESQAAQIITGKASSNYVDPKKLSTLERKQLKDAFSVIVDAQNSVKMNFRPGL